MRASLAALLGCVVIGCSGCILPVPHTRVHSYGVTGQVVSATTQEPLADASVIAMDQPDHPAHCDKAGRFRLHPKRGWHAAYCIGPVCESLLPGWDVSYPGRCIQVSAPGYATADFTVSAFARDGTNAVAGDLAGAWLKAAPLELHALRIMRNAECRVRNTEPRHLGCYEFMVGRFFRQTSARWAGRSSFRTDAPALPSRGQHRDHTGTSPYPHR
jgi:hypothetical protein